MLETKVEKVKMENIQGVNKYFAHMDKEKIGYFTSNSLVMEKSGFW